MTVYTTLNDVLTAGEEKPDDQAYVNQNTGYFVTPQPVGAGVYVLAELKAPAGYARSALVVYEVYSDKTQYYVDGDMYSKATAVSYKTQEVRAVTNQNPQIIKKKSQELPEIPNSSFPMQFILFNYHPPK